MTNQLIISIILALIIVLIFLSLNKFLYRSKKYFSKKSFYRKRSSVMNSSESTFFFELQKQLPRGYYVFPKMRIADILETVSGKDYYLMRNKILPKHIDFLVCDSHFKPLVAIEVNGAYHNNSTQHMKDKIKKEIFENVELSFESVDVGSDFSQSIKRVISNLI
jgi:hypothetical protein